MGSRVGGGVRNVSAGFEMVSRPERLQGGFQLGKKGLENLTERIISQDREIAEATQDECMEQKRSVSRTSPEELHHLRSG